MSTEVRRQPQIFRFCEHFGFQTRCNHPNTRADILDLLLRNAPEIVLNPDIVLGIRD